MTKSAKYYNKRKEEHRCTKCGQPLPEDWTRVQCERCRGIRREYERQYMRRIMHSKPPESSSKPRHTLHEVMALAAERHISYGEMVVILEKEEQA